MKCSRNVLIRSASVALISFLLPLSSVSAIDLGEPSSRNKEWGDGTYNAQASPLLVTSSSPPVGGDRVAIPGDPTSSLGIDIDGVARLFIDVDPAPGLGGICSGSLLESGQHVLTASHCVTNDDGTDAVIDGADGNVVLFDTPSGLLAIPFEAADVVRHPQYDGNFLHGFDVAVVDLGVVLPASIPRYALNSDLTIEGAPHLAVGYGQSGDGATGATLPAGTKRSGANNFEISGPPVGQILNLDTQLTADFDSGDAANNAFDVIFGLSGGINGGLGLGDDEVGVSPGDSGGPSLIVLNGQPVIAGVHSYGLRLELIDGTTSDVDGQLNSSFGEFSVDARVANPAVFSFIQQAIGIPEPTGCALIVLASGVLAMLRQTAFDKMSMCFSNSC